MVVVSAERLAHGGERTSKSREVIAKSMEQMLVVESKKMTFV